jgi:transketolase C-terminal domain/subunit
MTSRRSDKRVIFIGSDLSPGLLADMKKEMPERWYMEGITEANVIGMAAGLAMEGYVPYVNTIATFITRRCYEQVAVDLCLHELPVRLIGNGGGLVYAPLGPTHLAIEDIAIMRALPNMTVTAVCDAERDGAVDELRRSTGRTRFISGSPKAAIRSSVVRRTGLRSARPFRWCARVAAAPSCSWRPE